MENPQFLTREEIEKCCDVPLSQQGEFENELTEAKLIPELTQQETELTGWKAIQKTRKKRGYKTKQESPSSHPADKSCVHHWIIEEPNGTTSMGQCEGCGSEKRFNNFLWANENLSNEKHYVGAENFSGLDL